jgi:hypothetical protein
VIDDSATVPVPADAEDVRAGRPVTDDRPLEADILTVAESSVGGQLDPVAFVKHFDLPPFAGISRPGTQRPENRERCSENLP